VLFRSDPGSVLLVEDFVQHPRDLKETLPTLLRDGDLLLLLGAGDIGAAAAELGQLGHLRTSK
jgi:UDP-N-acetylmuramate--alanine ligase